ncbi:uncharacterized protein [Nicotiana tomentosiformis]|uniref:uncharacterized protein n=1 Tax=Nicotiana tomentosiformis TaxID=4098 RepID=UPI00388C3F0C
MSEHHETQNVPSVTPIEPSPVETPIIEPTLSTPTSPNPKAESPPPSASSPTQSSIGSHRSRKTLTPKKFVATTSSSASPKKMVEMDTVEEEENQEISSLPMEECTDKDQVVGPVHAESSMTSPSLESTCNIPSSTGFSMGLQEKEDIENMLSIAAKGVVVKDGQGVSESQGEENRTLVENRELVPIALSALDNTTGAPTEGLVTSTEEPTLGSSPEPQASTDHALSPHFYVELLSMVVPEMRSLSEEENGDSEEDYDDVAIASFIRPKSRQVATQEPTPKRPNTRLQKKEALESAIKKSQEQQKKRKLVKDGKVMNEKVVLVVTADDEVAEEPGSLTRKFSQKHSISKSKKGSYVSAESLNKSEGDNSSEKLVEESGEKVMEESVGKVSEKTVYEKLAEKGKSARKSVKRKGDASEEPGSSKKAKVDDTQDAGKEKLKNQKWTHLFTSDSPKVYEEEVRSFYADFFTVEDDHICMMVNRVDFVMDSAVLGSILDVPAEGLSSIQGSCSSNFRNAIVKDKVVQQGEHVHKNSLLPVYQLLFEMVNKVGTHKQTFSKTTLEECECIDKVGEVGSTSTITQLINAQNSSTDEIRKLKARNVILEGQLSQLQEAPSSSSFQSTEVVRLTKENADLKKQVEDLKEKLLNE